MRHIVINVGIVGLALACALAVAFVPPVFAQEEAQKSEKPKTERVMGFEKAEANFKLLTRTHLRKRNFKGVAEAAVAIAAWGDEIPSHFPPGSDAEDDRAKPEIWEDFATFEKLAANMAARARDVASAAEQESARAVRRAVKNMGKSCGACHKKFLVPKEDG